MLPPLRLPPPSVSHAKKLLHRGSREVANFHLQQCLSSATSLVHLGAFCLCFPACSFHLCGSAMFFHIKLWRLCGNQAAVEPHMHLLVTAACVASCVPGKTGRETCSFPNWEFEFYSFPNKVINRLCQSSPLGIVLFQVEPFCFKLTYKLLLLKYFRYGNSLQDPLSPEELQK